MKWDLFISYASEDKSELAEPLARKLEDLGYKVWYDDRILRLGDSLRAKLDEGLSNSQYGVVVLSPYFFKKNWPKKELDGFFARETTGKKVILPILHNLRHEDLARISPLLASRIYVSTERGLDEIIREVNDVFSSIEIALKLDTKTFTNFEEESIFQCVNDYVYNRNRVSRLKVSIDKSVVTDQFFPRLNEYKGLRASSNPPEEDYERILRTTNDIFENMEFLIQLFLEKYAKIVPDARKLICPIQKFCKLITYHIYDRAIHLFPRGKIQDWVLNEYNPIVKILNKYSEVSKKAFDRDMEMRAYLLDVESTWLNLDIVGKANITDISRLCIPDAIIPKDTAEWLNHFLPSIPPDTEISLIAWMDWFIPQILYSHATDAAYYNISLNSIKEKIGLMKSDYCHMGYH